eukprot:CAMPEP_0184699634 /NCGR_PEP_ID=MMETSP0313-20130426/5836_1 /TAXON_ID=2792 /ORGANISM="Porphyridium aerugineum, Strain SAG 1380-2" /LENGTH=184 /DNA_ID=CAMNT_0027158753 /DNA_START=118 /DNA_END=673 /DNA_ORIENTATION=+
MTSHDYQSVPLNDPEGTAKGENPGAEDIWARFFSDSKSKTLLFQDDELVAFHDISPGARVHVLVVPRREYIGGVETLETERHLYLLKRMVDVGRSVVEEQLRQLDQQGSSKRSFKDDEELRRAVSDASSIPESFSGSTAGRFDPSTIFIYTRWPHRSSRGGKESSTERLFLVLDILTRAKWFKN